MFKKIRLWLSKDNSKDKNHETIAKLLKDREKTPVPTKDKKSK